MKTANIKFVLLSIAFLAIVPVFCSAADAKTEALIQKLLSEISKLTAQVAQLRAQAGLMDSFKNGAQEHLLSWGYSIPTISRTIDTIVIHSCYDALGNNPYSFEGVIKEFKMYGVAPHYIIDRNGSIYQTVKDSNVAFQAGRGKYPETKKTINMNTSSLGIEMIYMKNEGPNNLQYESLRKLVGFLKSKYVIKYVVGHNQISVGGKTDPWNFDWNLLY